MAIKMPHAVKPVDTEQRAAAFISGAGAARSTPAPAAEPESGKTTVNMRFELRALEAHRPRREKSGHQPHGLASCRRVEGAGVIILRRRLVLSRRGHRREVKGRHGAGGPESGARRARGRAGREDTSERLEPLKRVCCRQRAVTLEAAPASPPSPLAPHYIGGTSPFFPISTYTASIEPSSAFGPRARTSAPGWSASREPSSKATIGVFGSTTIVCWPPL